MFAMHLYQVDVCLDYGFYDVLGSRLGVHKCGNSGGMSMSLLVCWLLAGQQVDVRRCVCAPYRHSREGIPIAPRGGTGRVHRHPKELPLARYVCHWPQRRICGRWCAFCFGDRLCFLLSLSLTVFFFPPCVLRTKLISFRPLITAFLYRPQRKCAYQRFHQAHCHKGCYTRCKCAR